MEIRCVAEENLTGDNATRTLTVALDTGRWSFLQIA
jgi:hypothetical protein